MKPLHIFPLGVVAQLLVAAPPEIDPEQLAEFERKVAPRILPVPKGEKNFEKADKLNNDVALRLANYLQSIEQEIPILTQDGPAGEAKEDDPFEGLFKPGPESLVISCSDGIYLDSETYELVYLGNIRIEGQGVTMTCKEDLKALFHPPGEKAAAVPKEGEEKEEPLAKFGGFGELKQFTAAGDVRLSGVNEEGKKFFLKGDRALYEMVKDGEKINSTITLRGEDMGFILGDPKDPNNKEGSVALRAVSRNATAVVTLKGNIAKVRLDKRWVTELGLPKK